MDGFENVPFHRVIADFVAERVIPRYQALAGPGITSGMRLIPDLLYDKEGVVGMANSGANTNGSQFFITLAAQQPGWTLHSSLRVVSGMDVVRSITHEILCSNGTTGTGQDLSVTITEK